MISRPALARRLGEALDRGAVVLVAPAGSGKTMALEEALSLREGAVGRVRCTAADGDAGRLLDHLVEVLRSAAPGTADVVGHMLATAFGRVDPATAVRELVVEIDRLAVDPLTVFFDDAEHVAESQDAAGIIGAFVASDSPALRVAVAARRELPLRLSKLRAAGRVTLVGAADLAFDAGECRQLLTVSGRSDVSDAEVRSAIEATEGWPLGLALTFARRGARRSANAVPASAGELGAYLVEEVLDHLDPDFRRDLVMSSLPPELSPRLVAALGLDPGFLERAHRRELFLRPLGPSGTEPACAYHPLFREFLLGRLAHELTAGERAELHARLAQAIGDERPLEAVEHWLAAGREPDAVKLMGRHSQPLIRSSPEVVRGWIGQLSASGRAEPSIKLLEGQLAMGDGRPDDAAAALRAAAREWKRRGSRAAWTARFALAQTYIVLGHVEEVPELADGLESPDAADVVAAPMVAMMASLASGAGGRRELGEELLERGLAHPLGHLLEPFRDGFRAYFVDWHAGRLDSAVANAERMTARLEEFDPMRWLPYMHWYTSYLEEARGDEAAAVTLRERSREATRRYGLGAFPAAVATVLKAGSDARAGRVAEAELELARAGPHLSASWFGYDVELTRAELAAQAGDVGALLSAAERAHARVRRGYLGERLRAATLLVPLLVRAAATERAREVIDEALDACPPHARAPRLVALRAWLRDLAGEPQALDDLAQAWSQAGDQVRYMLRAEWPRIGPLVWRAVEAGRVDPGPAVTAVHEAFPGGDALLDLVEHPLPSVRRAVAAAIASSGHREAPRRVAALTEDPDATVAQAARRAARRMVEDPPSLAFGLFGGFVLRRGGREVAPREWERLVAARLVRFLLVCRDAAVSEDLLLEAFWPDRPASSGHRSLQVAVSAARAVLDPPGATRSRLDVSERTYRLALGPRDIVDTEVFERAAATALADRGADRLAAVRGAAALWRGEPLPEERYEGWSAAWRARLVDLRAQLLTGIADACMETGDVFGAASAAARLVEVDPLNEAAQRTLMTAYARSGRRGHALRQFLDCRRTLVDELGIEPSAETESLQRAILAGEAV